MGLPLFPWFGCVGFFGLSLTVLSLILGALTFVLCGGASCNVDGLLKLKGFGLSLGFTFARARELGSLF